jgi:5-methylcytosine-specific restriction endonuclease McrA
LSASRRFDILERDSRKCVVCGRSASDGIVLHVDHIVPVSKGGSNDIVSLQTLCEECNLGKGVR